MEGGGWLAGWLELGMREWGRDASTRREVLETWGGVGVVPCGLALGRTVRGFVA